MCVTYHVNNSNDASNIDNADNAQERGGGSLGRVLLPAPPRSYGSGKLAL